MQQENPDPRLGAILAAAWRVFAAYGYRKTSMQDIAQGAGMSRPALYLHFRNKEEIFRHLVAAYYDTAEAKVRAALAAEGPIAERVVAAVEAQGGDTIRAMLASPHGVELLDTGLATAGDIATSGEARLVAAYAGWLNQQASVGRVRLDGGAEDIADTLMAALKGLKLARPDPETYRRRARRLALLVGAGLEP